MSIYKVKMIHVRFIYDNLHSSLSVVNVLINPILSIQTVSGMFDLGMKKSVIKGRVRLG